MVVEYRQADGSSTLNGYMMSDGPLSAATGQMVRGWHFKCFHVARKREARGNAVTGRVVADSPTAYDIDQLVLTKDDLSALGITEELARERGTGYLSARLGRLRALAGSLGLGVGDARVQEAFMAFEHGGPYAHQHHHRLEMYQLIAHLGYAHGVAEVRVSQHEPIHDQHAELHAQSALAGVRRVRLADEDFQEPRTTDWRTQYVVDIE